MRNNWQMEKGRDYNRPRIRAGLVCDQLLGSDTISLYYVFLIPRNLLMRIRFFRAVSYSRKSSNRKGQYTIDIKGFDYLSKNSFIMFGPSWSSIAMCAMNCHATETSVARKNSRMTTEVLRSCETGTCLTWPRLLAYGCREKTTIF